MPAASAANRALASFIGSFSCAPSLTKRIEIARRMTRSRIISLQFAHIVAVSLLKRRACAPKSRNMSITHEKLADLRVKHLEMIQSVITRMSSHSATLKNYCITITTAVCGFAVAVQRPGAAAIAILPILVCCYLDARYLRNEKRFRQLFDGVRNEPWTEMPSFQIGVSTTPHVKVRDVAKSWSVSVFYGGLIVALVIVILLTRYLHGKFF